MCIVILELVLLQCPQLIEGFYPRLNTILTLKERYDDDKIEICTIEIPVKIKKMVLLREYLAFTIKRIFRLGQTFLVC